ncbi:MAG: R3H domain-containing nucleic acid-binding protein [bacterium]
MDNQVKEILKQGVEELLGKIDLSGGVKVEADDDQIAIVKIESSEAGLLIGQGGENLAALQHLARIIVNKKLAGQLVSFVVDVNDYQANRTQLVREMALSLARQVVEEKTAKVLEPMSPYERRLVHLTLKDFNGVKTESQGEGEFRKVVIKPSDDLA